MFASLASSFFTANRPLPIAHYHARPRKRSAIERPARVKKQASGDEQPLPGNGKRRTRDASDTGLIQLLEISALDETGDRALEAFETL